MLPLSLELKLAGLALGAAAFLGFTAWAIHHERQIGESKCRAEVATATAQALANSQAESNRRTVRLQENVDAAYVQQRQAESDARNLRSARDGLLNAANSAGSAACNSSIASHGPAASATDVVPADLFRSIEERAEQLAGAADSARIAGQLCQRSYDSLTPKN